MPVTPAWEAGPAAGLLPVLITYDDLPAYRQALATVARAFQQLDESLELQPLPWPFHVLASAPGHARALAEIEAAEIVVIATQRAGVLPESVRGWLQACGNRPDGGEKLLIAMLGPPRSDGREESADVDYLRDLATRAGWEFLGPHAGEETPSSPLVR